MHILLFPYLVTGLGRLDVKSYVLAEGQRMRRGLFKVMYFYMSTLFLQMLSPLVDFENVTTHVVRATEYNERAACDSPR